MPATRLTLLQFFYAYGVALAVMGALDAIWLGWLAIDFYKKEMGPLMADRVRVVPAALYYLLYPLAIVYLALVPAQSLGEGVLRSLVLGLAAFGVYDMTCLAVMRGYTVKLALVDLAWGGFASLVGGASAYAVVVGRYARS
ncbi:MAG: DUF2177 family protein [Pseudomonadota bacterium]|nr:DUF2177 family protein [Pseudomonadota bacterium]